MVNDIKEKIERIILKTEILFKNNKRVFITDTFGTWFFADLIKLEEDRIIFIPFKGNHEGETIIKYFTDIKWIDEYQEVEE